MKEIANESRIFGEMVTDYTVISVFLCVLTIRVRYIIHLLDLIEPFARD